VWVCALVLSRAGLRPDRLRQLQQPPNASRRFLFHEPEVEHAGLSRGHWTAVNEWHTQLLAPVFEFRTLLWRYIMGSKFWLGRQEHVKEMARQQRELEEAGQGGMYHLTEVGMTAGAVASVRCRSSCIAQT